MDQQRLRDNLQAEIDGASLYRALARSKPGPSWRPSTPIWLRPKSAMPISGGPSSGRPG